MDTPMDVAAPILVVRDLEAAVATYCEVYGFRALRYFGGNTEYLVLDRAGAQVHVMSGRAANPNHRQSGHVADVFVWVDTLHDIVDRATAAGLRITRGPERYDSTPVATTEVVVEDAEGYWFCFAVAEGQPEE